MTRKTWGFRASIAVLIGMLHVAPAAAQYSPFEDDEPYFYCTLWSPEKVDGEVDAHRKEYFTELLAVDDSVKTIDGDTWNFMASTVFARQISAKAHAAGLGEDWGAGCVGQKTVEDGEKARQAAIERARTANHAVGTFFWPISADSVKQTIASVKQGKQTSASIAKTELVTEPSKSDVDAGGAAREKAEREATAEAERQAIEAAQAAERKAVADVNAKLAVDAKAQSDRFKAEMETARLAKEKYARDLAENERLKAEHAQREVEYLAAIEASDRAHKEWLAKAYGCTVVTSETETCKGKVPAKAEKKNDPQDEILTWKEGVTLCEPPKRPGSTESTCHGPLQTTYGDLKAQSGVIAINWACGIKGGATELGTAATFVAFGCGYGIHPEDPGGNYPGNRDVAQSLGVGFVPGRGEFHCKRRVSAYCRER